MFVILLVALFGVALVITLMGLYLSPRSQPARTRDSTYAPRAGARLQQGERMRYASSVSVEGLPVRRAQRYATVDSLPAAAPRRQAGWLGRWPRWLAIIVGATIVFVLCLLLFVQMMSYNVLPGVAVFTNFATQATPAATQGPLSVNNLGSSNASQAIARIFQLDQSQYSSADEYNTWAYSACSVAAMTEVINAYGHHYRLTDILKVEAGLGEISPDLGLLEAKGIDRTMEQFGFKMIPLENSSLDSVIAVANQGHPVFVSFASSDYWPGGHILVVRGGTAQDVSLTDSSRLGLTTVARDRFLSWWRGFAALAVLK